MHKRNREEIVFFLLVCLSTLLYFMGGPQGGFGGWVEARTKNSLKFWIEVIDIVVGTLI